MLSRGALRAVCQPRSNSHVNTTLIRAASKPKQSSNDWSAASKRDFYWSRRLHDESPASSYAIPPQLKSYTSSVRFPAATDQIAALLKNAVEGQQVVLHGYLGKRTDMGKRISFVRLMDPQLMESIQVVAFGNKGPLQQLRELGHNSPVVVKGRVQKKTARNEAQPAEIELALDEIQCLNEFPKDIIMTPETVFPPEKRFLQLRNDTSIREALRFRSKVRNLFRDALEGLNPSFIDVETPLLFKSTPEGAREFLVPTRRKGHAYALPQSPQQYKQILMASGIPRYYQFAKCFRDEDLRADRQPEFTQLDMEMSFATGEDVMQTMERTVKQVWSKAMPVPLPETPFPRITYEEAMSKYGSDKPDIRLGMEIKRVDYMIPTDLVAEISDLHSPIVECFRIQGREDPAEMDEFLSTFMDSPVGASFQNNPDGGPGTFVYDVSKPLSGLGPFGFEAAFALEEDLSLQHGDLLIIQARPNAPFAGGSTVIGDLRREMHKAAVQAGILTPATGFEFLWVHQFPLFSPNEESHPGQGGAAGFSATHHPFTAPKRSEDIALLTSNPSAVIADHYDLVLNGVELGGGSRRIHSAEMQEYVLRDILKMPEKRVADFAHLLEALRAGCPPHAGMALGFDRLIAVMMGKDSVRDVIAFPKTGRGEDVMVKCPSPMTEAALETYRLKIRED
ncbi:hypothetical protein KEM54_002410 [Ascosphaera aggregata]|nr:hypothetical protein KEM54_002410 [Ascosphaera aggregata]